MNVLIFYPRPYPTESIGSMLIRASSPHRLTPLQLLRRLGRSCKSYKSLVQATLRGDTKDIQQIARVDHWKPPLSQKSIVNSHQFDGWLGYTNAALCPRCAEQGWLPYTHDYTFMTTCSVHACKLIRICPRCEEPLRWNRANLRVNSCNHTITDVIPASELEIDEAMLLSQWIDSEKLDLIESYLAVRDTLVNRYQIFDTHPKRIQALLEGNPNDFVPVLQTILSNLNGIPQRAALAPLLTNGGLLVQEQLKLLDGNDLRAPVPVSNNENRHFYLTGPELSAALGLNPITADHLITQCLPFYRSDKREIKKIPFSSLVQFYQSLAPTRSNPNIGATLRQISASKKRAIGTLIKSIMRGEITPTYFDENADIGNLKIDDAHPSITGFPLHHLSLRETALRLNTYSMAVVECYKRSLLPGIKLHNKNHYAFRIEDIERFTREYIIGSNISGAAGVPIRGISEKLVAAGIRPVSGRLIDGSSVYIFRRRDLDGIDIDEISDNPNYAKHPNRGPKNFHGLDRSQWITSTVAAKQLGITHQKLNLFLDRKLLIEKIPDHSNSARRRYIRVDSVKKASVFIKSLMPLRALAKEMGISVRAVQQQMAYLGKSRPLRLKKIDYIEQADAEALRNHFLHHSEVLKKSP